MMIHGAHVFVLFCFVVLFFISKMKAEQDHESRNVFAIEGTKLVIHKRTKINHLTQM